MTPRHEIWVNARFLTRPVTGVERVAIELLRAFEDRYLDDQGRLQIGGQLVQMRLIIPSDHQPMEYPFSRLPIQAMGVGGGHLWEQLALPVLARRHILLNLCNTGPIFKRRNIVFLHDAGVFHIPDSYSLLFRVWYRFLMRAFVMLKATLITNSHFSQGALSSALSVDVSRIQIISLGYEHVQKRLVNDRALSKFDLKKDRFVLSVGSANPLKNHAGLIQAFESLPDLGLPLIVVGRVNTKVFNGQEPKSASLRDIRYLGAISDEELITLYRNATMLAIPSFYEGFGLPPLEAMALGCPVLLSNRGALPEVGSEAALYCDPEDTGSIAAGIERICSDQALRQSMSQKGMERAAHFSWKFGAKNIQQTIERELPQ